MFSSRRVASDPPRNSEPHSPIPGVLFVVVSVALALVGAELLLRSSPGTGSGSWSDHVFCENFALRRIMIPRRLAIHSGPEWQSVEFLSNQMGYRDSERWEKRGRHRIMLLGNSFGFGWGCPYERSVGGLLDQDPRYAVYNLSMPGDALRDYYRRFVVHRPAVRPDLALLLTTVNDFMTESADLHTTRTRAALALDADESYVPQCESGPRSVREFLRESRLFAMSEKLWISGALALTREDREKNPTRNYFARLHYFLEDETRRLDESLVVLRQILKEMKAAGTRLVIAFIPPRYAVEERAFEQLREDLGPLAEGLGNVALLEDRLREVSRDLGARYVGLGEALAQAPGGPVYYPIDGHLNEAGHAVIATRLHAALAGALD